MSVVDEEMDRIGLSKEPAVSCLARYDAERKVLVVLHESRTYVFPVVADSLVHLFEDLVKAAVR
jgi:hypothetical protein